MKLENQITIIFALLLASLVSSLFDSGEFFAMMSQRETYLNKMYSLSACIHFILLLAIVLVSKVRETKKENDFNNVNPFYALICVIILLLFFVPLLAFSLILIIGIYHQVNDFTKLYTTEVNIYILFLLIPMIMLISEKTRKYFVFVYVFAILITYYFYVYKYNHDFEVAFNAQGIECSRSDNPVLGCSLDNVVVDIGDEIETLDDKKVLSNEKVNTFCVNGDHTYYFQINNNIYKYIHKKHTEPSK